MAEYAITVYQEMHGEDVAIPKGAWPNSEIAIDRLLLQL